MQIPDAIKEKILEAVANRNVYHYDGRQFVSEADVDWYEENVEGEAPAEPEAEEELKEDEVFDFNTAPMDALKDLASKAGLTFPGNVSRAKLIEQLQDALKDDEPETPTPVEPTA